MLSISRSLGNAWRSHANRMRLITLSALSGGSRKSDSQVIIVNGGAEAPWLALVLARGATVLLVPRAASCCPRPPWRSLRREIVFQEDLDMVRWIKVRTAEGDLRELVFWAGPKRGDGIPSKRPLERIGVGAGPACGHAGPSRTISTTPCRTSKRSA